MTTAIEIIAKWSETKRMLFTSIISAERTCSWNTNALHGHQFENESPQWTHFCREKKSKRVSISYFRFLFALFRMTCSLFLFILKTRNFWSVHAFRALNCCEMKTWKYQRSEMVTHSSTWRQFTHKCSERSVQMSHKLAKERSWWNSLQEKIIAEKWSFREKKN